MHNVHNTKCLCGKGIAHAHFDNYSRFHSWITCPECSRKYHAHVFGLLPRHIPVKPPKDRLQKRIHSLQWHLRLEEPQYNHEDRELFLTDEERDIIYGPNWRNDSYPIIRYLGEKTGHVLVVQQLMAELAYHFSQYELLRMHDDLDDSIYNKAVEKILQKKRVITEEELQLCLRRTIIDYQKHKEAAARWLQSKEKDAEELQECLAKKRAANEELERMWQECAIPWESLEAVD